MLEKINKLIGVLGYKIQRVVPFDPVIEEEFGHVHRKCKNYSMVQREGLYALWCATKYLVNAKVEGDFVECGVWGGALQWLSPRPYLKLERQAGKYGSTMCLRGAS